MNNHKTERDAALTELARERAITDALFREFQKLATARETRAKRPHRGPVPSAEQIVVLAMAEIARLFATRGER